MATSLLPDQGLGDAVWETARRHGRQMGSTEFATSLRDHTLARERYIGYITATYPLIVAFNRGLMNSLSKLDPVSDVRLVQGLCRQLVEELDHNEMWRRMLLEFEIDHAAVYRAFMVYTTSLSDSEAANQLACVNAALSADPQVGATDAFVAAPVPEFVVALYLQVKLLGTDPAISYWEQYATQFAIEVAVVEVVSGWVYPGLVGRPDLDIGPSGLAWWQEHASPAALGQPAGSSDEERHQEMARNKLNGLPLDDTSRKSILARVEDTLRLLVSTMRCHDADRSAFSADSYRHPR